jgi:hypothetical protein
MRHAIASFGLAILVAASGLGTGASFAQKGYTPSSIEWLTASSDVVVLASVADLAFKDRAPEVPGTTSEWQHVAVTLNVHSTLKGKVPETITFIIDQPRGIETLPAWKKSAQPVLWFLVENAKDEKKLEGKLRLRETVELGSAEKKQKAPRPVLTMDLKALDREDAILDAVKAEVARRGQGRETRSVRIPISREVAQLTGQAGDANELIVPAADSRIRIDIAADKKEYPFRGAIRLTVNYSNTSKETVELLANGSVGGGGFPGEIYEVTSRAGRTVYTIHATDPSKAKETLEPGKSWKRELDLAALLSGANDGKERTATDPLPDPFGRLDEYKVRLMWQSPVNVKAKQVFCGPVESNVVKFSVRR